MLHQFHSRNRQRLGVHGDRANRFSIAQRAPPSYRRAENMEHDRSLAVSPALPLENIEAFADWIANSVDYALVDTFLAGDGSSGVRTGRSKTPEIFRANGSDWRNETEAKNLFRLLQGRMGNRVKWSQE